MSEFAITFGNRILIGSAVRFKCDYQKGLNLGILSRKTGFIRVSVQGVESLWGDCRFIPADWGS